jgi:hypothetical protein
MFKRKTILLSKKGYKGKRTEHKIILMLVRENCQRLINLSNQRISGSLNQVKTQIEVSEFQSKPKLKTFKTSLNLRVETLNGRS